MPKLGERKNQKRDEQIFRERTDHGTSFRKLGVKYGGLSAERTRQVFYREKRMALLRAHMEDWTKIIKGTNPSVRGVWKNRMKYPMMIWKSQLNQKDFLDFEENISRLVDKNEITADEADRFRSILEETKLDMKRREQEYRAIQKIYGTNLVP